MRCHICDKALSESEITQLPDGSFDCCSVCLEIAMETAYCDGFVKEEPLEDPELEDEFGSGAVAIFDIETNRSSFVLFHDIDYDDSDYGDDYV